MCIPKGKIRKESADVEVSVIEFGIDESYVTFSVVSQKAEDQKFFEFFHEDRLVFPLDVSPINFLRTEPQISFLADRVYSYLQSLKPIDLRRPEYYQVKKTRLLESLQQIFPPSLRTKDGYPIQQLVEGRVNKALNFLEKDGFVSIVGDFIRIPRDRGALIGDLFEHFIKLQAMEEIAEEERKLKAEMRRLKGIKLKTALPSSQTTLFDHIHRP